MKEILLAEGFWKSSEDHGGSPKEKPLIPGFSFGPYSTSIFIIAAIAVALVAIYFRVPMLQYYGFYEPDGYFHFTVVRAAVLNNFQIPQFQVLSGFPYFAPRPPHHEPFGLYWTTLIPYFFLRFVGAGYYDIFRLMPVVFALIDIVLAYWLARYWSKDRLFGLLVMLLIALNMGNAARTSALIYRGDSFVTAYLLLAMIFTLKLFGSDTKKEKIIHAFAVAFFLSLSNLVWNGAPFATAIFVVYIVVLLIYGFTFEKKKVIDNCAYLLGALLAWFWIVAIYKSLLWIVSGEAFTGSNFFLLFAPTALGWFLVNHFSNRGSYPFIMNSVGKRFSVSLIAIVGGLFAIYLIIPGFVNDIFVTSGFLAVTNFSNTIQELQQPTYTFLFASFGFQNYANPMSIIIMLSTYYRGLVVVFWFILVLTFLPYFFMQTEESGGGFMLGRARLRFHVSEPLLLLATYFALTAYLQMNAIRFNSLLSIPVSIFGAYTIYWLMLFLKRYRLAYAASYLLLALIVYYIVQTDATYIQGLAPADQVNPAFIKALAWMKNNTAPNSVVLTLWPDGSLVEAVANRTSITDSVGSQYAYKANPFAAWLYNSSSDPQFLLSNLSGEPDYLLVRNAWMVETGGIFTEANISVNASDYGYNPFTNLNEKVNKTTQLFQFSGGGLEVQTVISNQSNGQSISSYLVLGNGIQPFGYVAFYNVYSGNFSIIKQTAFNRTNNQTFLIAYSPIPANNLYVNITAAYMLSRAFANTNMVKFLFHCGVGGCLWNDNNIASMNLVYVNPDTKIFKITYNQSNPLVRALRYPRPRV